MIDQTLDRRDCAVGIYDNVIVHCKDENKNDKCLCKYIHIASDYSLVLNLKKSVVEHFSDIF